MWSKTMFLYFGICLCVSCNRVHRYILLFVGGVHVLFTLFVFVYVQWCPTHIMLWFWGWVFCLFVCLRFVYSMMPVSLDCPFIEHPILEYTFYYSFVLDTADIFFSLHARVSLFHSVFCFLLLIQLVFVSDLQSNWMTSAITQHQ